MKDLLSRYRPRYVHSLVYMLQASEYHIGDYIAWVHRANDFAHIEKRKTLVWTKKVIVIYSLTWLLILVWIIGIMGYVASTGSDVPLLVGAFVVAITPFFLPYAILLPLLVVRIAQWPVETLIINSARGKLSRLNATKIAIAGSYGKTSMREILKTILSEGKRVAAPPESVNTPLGIARFVNLLKGDEEVLIFELGEYYPGDIRKLCEIIRPQWGIITGVNEAHLEKFGTLEKTTATIFEIAAFVDPTHLYVNGESERVRARAKSRNVIYTREGGETWEVSGAKTGLSGTTFTLTNNISTLKASSKLLGLHIIGPIVAAVNIAVRLSLTIAQIERGVEKTKPFEHRLEPKSWGDSVTLIDDSYNGNPDGVAAVIDFLANLKDRRRWYVTPGLVEMGARKESVHTDIGKRLSMVGIEKVVLIRNSVTPFIERGLKDTGYGGEIFWYEDMPHALDGIKHSTVAGDIVLIQNDWPDQYA